MPTVTHYNSITMWLNLGMGIGIVRSGLVDKSRSGYLVSFHFWEPVPLIDASIVKIQFFIQIPSGNWFRFIWTHVNDTEMCEPKHSQQHLSAVIDSQDRQTDCLDKIYWPFFEYCILFNVLKASNNWQHTSNISWLAYITGQTLAS